jgi:hypothetical protein
MRGEWHVGSRVAEARLAARALRSRPESDSTALQAYLKLSAFLSKEGSWPMARTWLQNASCTEDQRRMVNAIEQRGMLRAPPLLVDIA